MDQQDQNQQYNHNQQYNPYANTGFGMPLPSIPNATAIMILGICSIVFCGLGPILGTLAVVLSKNAKSDYEGRPGAYNPDSYSNVKTGRICGIIGICIGVLAWLAVAAYFIFWWYMMKKFVDAAAIDQQLY